MSNRATIGTIAAAAVAAVLAGMGLATLAGADVLLIENVLEAPANSPEGMLRPRRGMSKAEVETRYGAPGVKHPAVGDPPISRWDYPRFSVFFETDHVIHSVVRHPSAQ